MQLKNRLKELRARDGLNQTDLAKLAGGFQTDHQPIRTGRIHPRPL